MGHKVNAVGMRIGFNREWNSKWYAGKKDFATYLHEDLAIRKYLDAALKDAMVSHIEIGRVRTDKGHDVRINAYVARPGIALGQDGSKAKEMTAALNKLVASGTVHLGIVEVKNPDVDAILIGKWIASEIENRASFRSTQKKAMQKMRKAGAKGCRTLCGGRLGGAEIARNEGYKEGVVPLHTLRADIDFARVDAHTAYGRIGVKVWICRSLNKTDMKYVNEEAPGFGPRRDRRDASKGEMRNAAAKAR